MISRRQIRYFLAVVETGRISAAARLVNVSQSTVTLSIKDLENILGTTLFVRDPNGFVLTSAGHKFLTYARDIETSFTAAERYTVGEREHMRGRVRLGMSETISGYFAFPLLSRFSRSHPEVDIEFREATRLELEAGLLAGELDLCLLLTSNLSEDKRIRSQTLHRSIRQIWTAPDHPLTQLKDVSLADVARYPMALLDSDEANRQPEKYWSQTTGFPNVIFVSRSIEAIRNIVASGNAVTILSDLVYRPWTLDGMKVEKLPLIDRIPTMDIGLAWPRHQVRSSRSLAMEALLETLAGSKR